jgi:hypothetical protein
MRVRRVRRVDSVYVRTSSEDDKRAIKVDGQVGNAMGTAKRCSYRFPDQR